MEANPVEKLVFMEIYSVLLYHVYFSVLGKRGSHIIP